MPLNPPAWSDRELANPHAVDDKSQRVRAMFAAIAPAYDLNNRLHSMGRDQAWRRAAVKAARVRPGDVVLDVACGTGDLTLALARTPARAVLGIDFTYDMLAVAQRKQPDPTACAAPAYVGGDAMRLPVADVSVDVVSIAFGIRNVADPVCAVREFFRVMRPGGRLVILEFSTPRSRIVRAVYNLYFRHVMPRTAAWIAHDRTGAYRYLPRSVSTFIEPPQMLRLLREAGFTQEAGQALTCGIAVVYSAVKPRRFNSSGS
jgi:demethylmenaquinone methyltransferase/2-methoxy-6-polyprenyl-1,4-benzoquinol methylase